MSEEQQITPDSVPKPSPWKIVGIVFMISFMIAGILAVWLGVQLMGAQSQITNLSAQVQNLQDQVIDMEKDEDMVMEEEEERLTWEDIPMYEAVNDPSNDTWQDTEWETDEEYNQKQIIGVDAETPSYFEVKDLNSNLPPNTFVLYEYENDVFKLPFNPGWGNDELALTPYDVTTSSYDKSIGRIVSLHIGPMTVGKEGGPGWGRGNITLVIEEYDSVESELNSIESGDFRVDNPQRTTINGDPVLRYVGLPELASENNTVVLFRNKYKYTLTSSSLHSTTATFEEMEDIIRTFESN